jgi:hypothetical protein
VVRKYVEDLFKKNVKAPVLLIVLMSHCTFCEAFLARGDYAAFRTGKREPHTLPIVGQRVLELDQEDYYLMRILRERGINVTAPACPCAYLVYSPHHVVEIDISLVGLSIGDGLVQALESLRGRPDASTSVLLSGA